MVYFNFRGDRALEITAAFEQDQFDKFDRVRRPKVEYAGMMQYDGDAHVPKQYIVEPPSIDRTMGEYLVASKVKLLAISETQKYGHVTYFFNGNRQGKFSEAYEDYVEVPSDRVPFEQRPWMKCAEITDKVIEAIESGNYSFIRLNYPNGDMVGPHRRLPGRGRGGGGHGPPARPPQARRREGGRHHDPHRRPRQLRRHVRARQEDAGR